MKNTIKTLSFFALLFCTLPSYAQLFIDNFEAQQTPDGILLNWSITSGVPENSIFDIYKSGVPDWTETGNFQIITDDINQQNYQFTDVGPFTQGTYVYYLALYDQNQTFFDSVFLQINLIEDPHYIQGKVAIDEDGDCQVDASEPRLSNWIIEASNGTETYYSSSLSQGNYFITVPSGGDWDVSHTSPNPYWGSCVTSETITATLNQTSIVDFPADIIIECPLMTVDLGTNFLVRCIEGINKYYVTYCNEGTITADNASIQVTFDDFLIINSSEPNWTSQDGNTFTFELGDVAINDCSYIVFDVDVSCDADLGQTHCSEALIFPNENCLPVDPLWDGSSVEVAAECQGDEVIFTIKNVGTENMTQPLNYLVVEDNVMLMQGNFTLDAGQSSTHPFPATGTTLRLEADQSLGHPGFSQPAVAVEGCGDDPISLGFVNLFPEDDENPFISIDCINNVASYDPNDKQAFPKGYDDAHYIEANQSIEYHIRFQNVGTAPAFNIIVVDTLDANLDLASIQPGASSFLYTFRSYGNGIIHFEFKNILLPDSTTNEPASHGFVKFRIQQKADLPLGTVINNDAAIYFDFNEPVITNETWHTIGEDFVTVSIFEPTFENLVTKVYPNPFVERARFELTGLEKETLIFNLFDLSGKLVRQEKFENATFDFERKGLLSGTYLFEIQQDGVLVGAGKLMVH